MEFILEEIGFKAADIDPDCGIQQYDSLINKDWKLDPHVECQVLLERLPSTQELLMSSDSDSDETEHIPTSAETSDVYSKFKLMAEELMNIFTKCEEKCGVCVEHILKLCQHIAQTHESESDQNPPSTPTSSDFYCDICGEILSNSSEFIRHHRESHSNPEASEQIPVQVLDEHHNNYPPFNTSFTIAAVPIIINLTSEPDSFTNNFPPRRQVTSHDHANGIVDVVPENSVSAPTEYVTPKPVVVPAAPIFEHVNVNSCSTTENEIATNDDASECQEVFSSIKYSKVPKVSLRKFTCEKCGKDFATRNHFVNHMMNDHGETKMSVERTRPFKCDTCGKSYRTNPHLSTHKLVHTGERRFKCDECGKCYARSCGLKAHKFFHRGQKPFECDECEKCFRSLGELNRHKKVESGKSHGPKISSLPPGETTAPTPTPSPSLQDFINIIIVDALSTDADKTTLDP